MDVDEEVDVDKMDVKVDDEVDNKNEMDKDAPEQGKTNSLLPRVRSKKAGGWWKVGCRAWSHLLIALFALLVRLGLLSSPPLCPGRNILPTAPDLVRATPHLGRPATLFIN